MGGWNDKAFRAIMEYFEDVGIDLATIGRTSSSIHRSLKTCSVLPSLVCLLLSQAMRIRYVIQESRMLYESRCYQAWDERSTTKGWLITPQSLQRPILTPPERQNWRSLRYPEHQTPQRAVPEYRFLMRY